MHIVPNKDVKGDGGIVISTDVRVASLLRADEIQLVHYFNFFLFLNFRYSIRFSVS
jgi:hypothetical protein